MPTKSDIRLYPGCTLTVCEASWLFIKKIILTRRMRRKEARFSLAGEFSHHRVQIVKNITWDCLLKPDFEVVHITRQILFLEKVHFCCSTSCVSRPFGFYSNRSNASCLQCHFSPLGVNLLLLLLLLVPISQSDILKLTTGAFHPLFFHSPPSISSVFSVFCPNRRLKREIWYSGSIKTMKGLWSLFTLQVERSGCTTRYIFVFLLLPYCTPARGAKYMEQVFIVMCCLWSGL